MPLAGSLHLLKTSEPLLRAIVTQAKTKRGTFLDPPTRDRASSEESRIPKFGRPLPTLTFDS